MGIKKGLESDIKVHETAAQYASEWNQNMVGTAAAEASNNLKQINVQIPSMIRLEQSVSRGLSSLFRSESLSDQYVTVEDYLAGHWQKFNSNTGWTQDGESVLNAFSHWTYN